MAVRCASARVRRDDTKCRTTLQEMLSHAVVSLALIVTVMLGAGLLDQDATAGRLMAGSSPIGDRHPARHRPQTE